MRNEHGVGAAQPEDVVGALASFVRVHCEAWDGSHGFEHAERVAELVRSIAATESALDRASVAAAYAAAWLHDVCDSKYQQNATMLDDVVVPFLRQANYTAHQIELASVIIRNMSFTRELAHGLPEEVQRADALPYYRLVSDADRLEALGVTGWLRTFMYQGHKGGKVHDAYEHVTKKLMPLCFETLHFRHSRELGAARVKHMEEVLRLLSAERRQG